MKYIVFALTLLFANLVQANTYTINDFYYNDNGNVVLLPQPMVYLFGENKAILNKIVGDNAGIIKEVKSSSQYSPFAGIIIETNDVNDAIILLNKYSELLPVVKSTYSYQVLLKRILLYVQLPTNENDVRQYLTSKLGHNNYDLSFPYANFGGGLGDQWCHVFIENFGIYKNPLFFVNSLNKNGFLTAKPQFSIIDSHIGNVWLEGGGVGNIGELRKLHVRITVPDYYKINKSEIPNLTHEFVVKILPFDPANLPLEVVVGWPNKTVVVQENLIDFEEPTITESFNNEHNIYDIVYPFMIYDIGDFTFTNLQFFFSSSSGSRSLVSLTGKKEFHVTSLLNPSITDIQYIPDNYVANVSIAHVEIYNKYILILIVAVILLIISLYAFVVSIPNKKQLEEKIVSPIQQIMLAGFTEENWREQYHALLREFSKITSFNEFPYDELSDELEKAYAADVVPDFDRLKSLVSVWSK